MLWKIMCQQTGQHGRAGQISRNIQTTKTEKGINRKFEQTHNQQRNWISNLKFPNTSKSWARWLPRENLQDI